MILEMIDVVKNYTLRLANRMVTAELLVYREMIQVNVFYVVHHVGNAAKAASALLVRIPFVTDTEYALCLLADEGNLHGRGGGVRTRTFFLHRSLTGWRGPLPLSLLLRSECDHEIDGTDLAADDILYIQVRREVAEDPLQTCPLFELMLNNRTRQPHASCLAVSSSAHCGSGRCSLS